MSKKKSEKVLESGHVSVSNRPEDEDFALEEFVSVPPSSGEGAETGELKDDGIEGVEGAERISTEMVSDINLPSEELRDIAEASFGEPPPATETVHGPDNRIRISNTSVYPWRAHADLHIVARDNSQWVGTGWFIGPHTLMTAGHVVYIKGSGVPGRDGWVKRITVMPGRNGSSLPYGSVTSTSFRSVTGWTNSGDWNYDYGAIIIPTNLGNTVGWFGFGVYSNSDLLNTTGNLSGYPADKTGSKAHTQWYDWHKIASVTNRKVYYDIDTFGGQSGSAVYRIKNGGRYAFAIHAYGGATVNSGTRIVTPVYNNMINWKA